MHIKERRYLESEEQAGSWKKEHSWCLNYSHLRPVQNQNFYICNINVKLPVETHLDDYIGCCCYDPANTGGTKLSNQHKICKQK